MIFDYRVNDSRFQKLVNDISFIHYEFLLGDVKIIDGLNSIDLNFNLPLLDFSNAMFLIMKALENVEQGREVFDFTEGEGLLIFTKNDLKLKLFSDCDDSKMTVDFKDFCRATIELNLKIKDYIKQNVAVNDFPELENILCKF